MIRFYTEEREMSLKEIHETFLPESTYQTFYSGLMEQIDAGKVHFEDSSVQSFDSFCNKRMHQRREKIKGQILDQYVHTLTDLGKKQKKNKRKEYKASKQYKTDCLEAYKRDSVLKQWKEEGFPQQKYAEYLEKCKGDSKERIKIQIEEYFLQLKEDAFLQLDIYPLFHKYGRDISEHFQEEIDKKLRNEILYAKVCRPDDWSYSRMECHDEELEEENLEEFIENFQSDLEVMILKLIYDSDNDFIDLYVVQELFQRAEELRELYDGETDLYIFMDLFPDSFDFKYDVLREIHCSPYHIVSCLMDNPHYQTIAEAYYKERREKLDKDYFSSQEIEEIKRHQLEREQFLKNSIISTIPKTYKDLYPFARKIRRKFILHIGPTNSGKTYHAMKALRENGSGIYLAPLRLLAYEQFENLNRDGCACDLITGEEKTRIPFAKYQSSTIEVADYSYHYSMAVIDEAQMMEDEERGGAWTMALLGLWSNVIHVCAAPYALDRIIALIEECGDDYEVIHHKRDTKLVMEKAYFHFPEDVREKDALIVFSKRNVHAVASELQRLGRKCSIIYGNLPYDVRQEEARRFLSGETEILVSTDAIGMGMNLPIRRIVFLESKKFDGKNIRPLKVEEIQQISGRAGRKGMYEIGLVNAEEDKKLIQKALETEVPPILNAVITFPESLLGIDAPLSETLERWNTIKTNAGYEKANIEEQIRLCRELETECDDKKLIYDFITIPFDSGNEEIKHIWYTFFQDELKEHDYNYKRFLPDLQSDLQVKNLNALEEDYKICDLLYFYMERFHGKENFEDIIEFKKSISSQIIKILGKQKLVAKKCKRCKRPLPWNHPYTICEFCYRRQKEEYAWNYMYR